MSIQTFFNKNSVFNIKDFADFYSREYMGDESSRRSLMKYYQKTGRVKQIRKGLYLNSPAWETIQADPYIICSKIFPDAVLAYHTALQFLGRAYSVQNNYVFCSKSRIHPFKYNNHSFKSVLFPHSLLSSGNELFGVQTIQLQNQDIKLTGFERIMVDVMQRPDLGGGWEEIWRSLEMIEYLDISQVIHYVELLDNATTASKVGFFLEQHREQLFVSTDDLDRLKQLRPESPHYMDRSHDGDMMFSSDWNLVVPRIIVERRWEEQ